MSTVIELVNYQLKAGVSFDQIMQIQPQVNQFLQSLSGFIYRSFSQKEDGTLVDIVYWQDMQSAQAAGEAFMHAQAGQMLIELSDMDSVVMTHMPVISEVLNNSNM